MKEIINTITENLSKKIEEHFIEGLKRKGFEFENKFELMEFVKNRCSCKHYNHEKTYYVDNIPFLLHHYKIEPLQPPFIMDRELKINVDFGYCAYL